MTEQDGTEQDETEVVFFSWQSDAPARTNRTLIEEALVKAIREIRSAANVKLAPREASLRLDKDTAGVPGSPDISRTIFEKIKKAAVFVCDVSIINPDDRRRPTPNPNVMVEYGFALAALGDSRIITVMNDEFGGIEKLPFDIRSRRVHTYTMPTDPAVKPAEARNRLVSILKAHLGSILKQMPPPAAAVVIDPKVAQVTTLKRFLVDDQHRIELDDLMRRTTADLVGKISQISDFGIDTAVLTNETNYPERVKRFEEHTDMLLRLMITGCYYGETKHHHLWRASLQSLTNYATPYLVPPSNPWALLRQYPALQLLYGGGIAALAADRFEVLADLLKRVTFRRVPDRPPGSPVDLIPECVIPDSPGRWLAGPGDQTMPAQKHLQRILAEPLALVISDQREYYRQWDRFEYLHALLYLDLWIRREGNDLTPLTDYSHVWLPRGLFATHLRMSEAENVPAMIGREIGREGQNWGPVRAGLFDSLERVHQIRTYYDSYLIHKPWR